jgi:MerR family transcriptional regulator/heat shock protein HspR
VNAVGQRLALADRLPCRVNARGYLEVRRMQPFEDEDVPLFTVGQVAEMLSLKQAFLRRVDQLQVVSPQRSTGGQRRYTRIEIRIIQQVASMADEGMTMPAIRRIIQLEQQLAEIARHRDELAARLAEVSEERARLARQLTMPLPPADRDGNAHRDRDDRDRDDRDRDDRDRAFEPGPRRDEG